jgi:mRNA interferase YafQ
MLILQQTSTFKRSLKKYRHDEKLLLELEKVVALLLNEQNIPEKYRDHELKGKFKGVRELHLRPDDLLLYVVIQKERVILMGLGSHSELFKW